MKDNLSQNKSFFLTYLLLLSIGILFAIKYTKADIHLYINQFHNPFCDVFFKYITNLGDGIFLPVYVLIMIMMRYRNAVVLVLVFIVSGLVVQILKRTVFADIVRPVEFFKNIADLYLVPGVKQNCCNSFPSGHSATAFGMMVMFAMVAKKNYVKMLVLFLACLIAYSRMYLSQHFLIDIMAGSFIGTITAVLFYIWGNKWKGKWLDLNVLGRNTQKVNYSLYD